MEALVASEVQVPEGCTTCCGADSGYPHHFDTPAGSRGAHNTIPGQFANQVHRPPSGTGNLRRLRRRDRQQPMSLHLPYILKDQAMTDRCLIDRLCDFIHRMSRHRQASVQPRTQHPARRRTDLLQALTLDWADHFRHALSVGR